MANGIYEVPTNILDDRQAIQTAINNAQNANGGIVLLANKQYNISQSIQLSSNIILQGLGASSQIRGIADVPIIQVTTGTAYAEIKNLKLVYDNSIQTSNHFHIEADRTLFLKIKNVIIEGPGRSNSGILTWDASTSNKTIPISGSSTEAHFMTHIENCLLNEASIWLNDSDSRILNNYIWANSTSTNLLPYAIRLSNGSVNISGNDIVPGNDAGIYLASTCSLIRIENNYFDGSWNTVHTGWGIELNAARQCIIVGNTFANMYYGGIKADNSHQNTVLGNIFNNLNRSRRASSRYDVSLTSTNSESLGLLYMGNQHFRDLSGEKSIALYANSGVDLLMIGNSVIDWSESSGGYCQPAIRIYRDDNQSYLMANRVTNSRINGNSKYPLLTDYGQTTVGAFTEVVNTRIDFSEAFQAQQLIPKVQDININFVGAQANSRITFSIYNLSASGFNISFARVDSSCSTAGVFFWRVDIH